MICPCEKPGWCEKYQRVIVGRLWEICQGINISPTMQQQYFDFWAEQAMSNPQSPPSPGTTYPDYVPPAPGVANEKKPCGCSGNVKSVLT